MTQINNVVSLARQGNVSVITLNNPPVNALSHPLREGLLNAIVQAGQDKDSAAVVIVCEGQTFIAGADITEFGKPPKDPRINAVIAAIEDCPQPVVAAMHGTVLGGGLELALGCHYRVAVPSARFGFPEVNLGIIPGAGGTQRLPRIVGVERAIEMITSANQVSAAQALDAGLIDEVVQGDLLPAAVAFAQKLVADKRPLKRVRDRDEKLAPARGNTELFAKARKDVARKVRGLRAPLAAIDAIEAAVNLPFDQSLAREREIVMGEVGSDQSKALRYFFFAERESAKIPGIDTSNQPKVQQAFKSGAGVWVTMGFIGLIGLAFAGADIGSSGSFGGVAGGDVAVQQRADALLGAAQRLSLLLQVRRVPPRRPLHPHRRLPRRPLRRRRSQAGGRDVGAEFRIFGGEVGAERLEKPY